MSTRLSFIVVRTVQSVSALTSAAVTSVRPFRLTDCLNCCSAFVTLHFHTPAAASQYAVISISGVSPTVSPNPAGAGAAVIAGYVRAATLVGAVPSASVAIAEAEGRDLSAGVQLT